MKKAVSMLAGCLAVLVSVSAQQPTPATQLPTFRTGVDAIQLDVSVLDKDRRPVRGLTAADFTVLEDGKPREVVAFSAVELPAAAPPDTSPSKIETVPPDVTRNDLPVGRIVVILMDPFLERVMVPGRVTIADPPGITALRATAASVVNGLGPGDLAAVGHTMYGVPQNFTTDKNRLKRAIDTTAFGTNKRAEGEEWGNCNCGTCRLEAITRVANALRDEPQRRKVVFFIGERIQLAPVPGQCNAYLEAATKQMTLATQLANVTVNTVDPNAMETTNVHAGDDFQPQNPFGSISKAAAAQEVANRAFLIERHQSLQTVADWTGGRAVLNTNAPEESVRPILEESSAYYLLAFQTDVKRDGRFHQIAVKVNRPDVQVRTRRGHYADPAAPAADPAAPLSLEALSRGLLPDRGLPMTVSTAAFRGPIGAPIVLVTTGVRGSDKAGPAAPRALDTAPELEPIAILTSAFRDGDKNVDWQRQRVSAALPSSTPGQLRYESVSTLTLQPGTYEIRVAARHEHENVTGSVHAYVDVPDFDRDALSLSGAVLLDRRAPTLPLPEALAGILDTAPTTKRDFTRGEEVTVLVRVYQRTGQQPTAVKVFFHVFDDALNNVRATGTLLRAEEFAGTGAADARFPVALDSLRPGAYVLRIGISEADPALSRDVRLTVK
jgi:VWFA-related protein